MGRPRRQKRARSSTTTPATSGVALDAPDSFATREALVSLLVVSVATVLVYSNTFDASFHFDDITSIVRNASVHDLRSQWPPSGRRYLGHLSFALNYRFGGLEVLGYHVANLLIHLCNALLVFWLTALTLRSPIVRRAEVGPLVRRYLPLAAGLLFAVHPVETQAVTYIVQRFASLATLFFLLSLVLYVQARLTLEADRAARARAAYLYCLSILAAAAAMKTKEISFTLPFVVAGYEFLFFRPGRRLLLAPLGATALLVPLDWATQGQKLADVLGDASRFAAETREIPRSVYLLTQSRVVVTYLRLMLLPVGQNLDYDFRLSHSPTDPGVLFAVTILVTVVASAVLLLRRARQTNQASGILVFFGILWFFVTLAVESSVIPIRDVIYEHRTYLPSVGAALVSGTALLSILERLRLHVSHRLQAAVALLVTAGPLASAAYARNFVWKDDLTLWSDVVAKSPEKARPHINLGVAHLDRGATSEAIREFQVALQIRPESSEAHFNLGNAYRSRGQRADAEQEYREAIRLAPEWAYPHINLGVAHLDRGDPDEAVSELLVALKNLPESPEVHHNLGKAFRAKGQPDDAIREYREAIRLEPRLAEAHDEIGDIFHAKGQLDDAIGEYHEAIRIAPELAGAHNNLGAAYLAKGRPEDAVREYREAVRLDPGLAGAHSNLGDAYQARAQLDDAVREYREAIRLDPGLAEAHNNLADAYLAKGELEQAMRECREAIRLDPGMAEAHAILGSVLLKLGRAADAVEENRRALALKPLPEVIINLAVALEAAGRRGEALAAYQRFLKEAGDTYPDRAEMVRSRIAQLRVRSQPGSH